MRSELVRWCGSIGIFYILIPIYLVASEPLLRSVIPWSAPHVRAPALIPAFAALLAIGAFLAWRSIRAQITLGRGHPFDMTGGERFSRPTQILLTRGVYALCRNPMGLGDILIYLGLTGLADAGWSLVLQVPAYVMVVLWNHRFNERPALLARFGEAYRAYERAAPLLVPTPRSLRAALRAHREPIAPRFRNLAMLFMVIERFRDLPAVGERFRTRGRMMPAGVEYLASWMTPDGAACYQVMRAPAPAALEPWLNAWRDLVDFEVVEVEESQVFWARQSPHA